MFNNSFTFMISLTIRMDSDALRHLWDFDQNTEADKPFPEAMSTVDAKNSRLFDMRNRTGHSDLSYY